MYAKSHLKLLLSDPITDPKKKQILNNLFYNEPWLNSIIFKCFKEDRPFSKQLELDIDYFLNGNIN